ncbi:hypothetical protein HUU53_01585 [Candidatus Micrarchaeota archaeon]|nr:hypothetical protein [Candidatus Micrarchaeota archaeon]
MEISRVKEHFNTLVSDEGRLGYAIGLLHEPRVDLDSKKWLRSWIEEHIVSVSEEHLRSNVLEKKAGEPSRDAVVRVGDWYRRSGLALEGADFLSKFKGINALVESFKLRVDAGDHSVNLRVLTPAHRDEFKPEALVKRSIDYAELLERIGLEKQASGLRLKINPNLGLNYSVFVKQVDNLPEHERIEHALKIVNSGGLSDESRKKFLDWVDGNIRSSAVSAFKQKSKPYEIIGRVGRWYEELGLPEEGANFLLQHFSSGTGKRQASEEARRLRVLAGYRLHGFVDENVTAAYAHKLHALGRSLKAQEILERIGRYEDSLKIGTEYKPSKQLEFPFMR